MAPTRSSRLFRPHNQKGACGPAHRTALSSQTTPRSANYTGAANPNASPPGRTPASAGGSSPRRADTSGAPNSPARSKGCPRSRRPTRRSQPRSDAQPATGDHPRVVAPNAPLRPPACLRRRLAPPWRRHGRRGYSPTQSKGCRRPRPSHRAQFRNHAEVRKLHRRPTPTPPRQAVRCLRSRLETPSRGHIRRTQFACTIKRMSTLPPSYPSSTAPERRSACNRRPPPRRHPERAPKAARLPPQEACTTMVPTRSSQLFRLHNQEGAGGPAHRTTLSSQTTQRSANYTGAANPNASPPGRTPASAGGSSPRRADTSGAPNSPARSKGCPRSA